MLHTIIDIQKTSNVNSPTLSMKEMNQTTLKHSVSLQLK